MGIFQLAVHRIWRHYHWEVCWHATDTQLDSNDHSNVFIAQALCLMAVADFYTGIYRRFFYRVKGQGELTKELAWDLIAGGLVDVEEINTHDLCLFQSEWSQEV